LMNPEISPVTNNRQIIKIESSYSTTLNPREGRLPGKAAWYSGHLPLSLSRSLAIPQ